MSNHRTLVLWDIDRTLLYVGNTDRRVYRDAFLQVVGREATHFPARGSGATMPMAIRELLEGNTVPLGERDRLASEIVAVLPELLAGRLDEIREEGQLMPGAKDALLAVHASESLLPTVVTGNLRRNAEIKLAAFGLDRWIDTEVGGYASDDANRPALVAAAQARASAKYGNAFDRGNVVIIGDSLEDVRTGLKGGAAVIGVASGKTSAEQLADAGAEAVIESLEDTDRLLGLIALLSS